MDTDSLYGDLATESFRAFSEKLSKDDRYPVKGERIPDLRKLAKKIDDTSFPVKYHEDVILKGLVIAERKVPFTEKTEELDALLPYLSAWDHTDVIASSIRIRKGDAEPALLYFMKLLKDERVFPRRLAIIFLMAHRKLYDRDVILSAIVSADNPEYYVSMAVAWALSVFYVDDRSTESCFSLVSEETRRRTMQKIRDSRRC